MALIALVRVAGAGATTVDDLPAGDVYTVGAIRIEGNVGVSARTIRAAMFTKVPPWYKLWQAKHAFNPTFFRTDLERVRTLLRERGYYQAELAHDLEIDGAELTIVLRVEEGPAALVGAVVIEAVDVQLTEADERALRAEITFASGDVFEQAVYGDSRARLERFYSERGFAYVQVDKAALVDTRDSTAGVTYTITRGPPAVFGATEVRGTERVAERLVRREISYRAGDPFDPREIEHTQASVFGLHLFRSVTVKPANLAKRSGVVDMAIEVVEGPARSVELGIGYGLEDELRGQARWQSYDFFGGGRQLGFRLKASSLVQAFESEFRQPYFLHPKQSFIVPLTQAREDEPAFTVARVRLAPRIERKLPGHFKAAFGYNVEYDDLSNVSRSTVVRLDEFEARGYVSSLTAFLERNTTLDLLDPRQGSVLTLSMEQAGGPWRGDYSFFRALLEAKKYVPVPGERVIAGRFRLGAGDGFGQSRDLPMFRRFFAGGSNSTRGYDRHLVGPLDEFRSPVGGRSLVEASIEFRTPIYKKISGVAFIDTGEVRLDPFSYTLGDLQYGIGAGLRYQTLIGPLGIDIGFPLEPPPGEPSWQIHFNIGQAF